MNGFSILYLPIGVPTFHLETAEAEFRRSRDLLRRLITEAGLPEGALKAPQGPLLSLDALEAFLEGEAPSVCIVQNATFASAAYVSRVLRRFDAPILLWALREPAGDGGRLRLNSLTGAYAAANTIRAVRPSGYSFVLGAPDEPPLARAITAVLKAVRCRQDLRGKRLLTVGHTPEGFGFGRAGDAELLKTFGLLQESIESRELIQNAKACSDEELRPWLDETSRRLRGFDELPETNRRGHARLYKAYAEYVRSHAVSALSSRCWPDFFTEFGTPVCAVLSLLNDDGIPAACETDTFGALSMLIGRELSGGPVFFGDPSVLDTAENAIIFWHCGMAAPSLARPEEGPLVGVHCNRGVGPTMEFGCRGDARATVFRVGREPDGSFRFFLGTGTILDRPRQFHGTSLVVRWDSNAEEMVHASVRDGWEPHFVVMYGDCAPEITELAALYGIRVWRY